MPSARLPGSFRDPSGFVYMQEGILLRQINKSYSDEFEFLINSGLHKELTEAGLLIPHEPWGDSVIKPERVSFISHPYEWCFSQYQDAALLTLEIQRRALCRGM